LENPSRFDLGDVEHIVDQRQQVIAALVNDGEGFLVRQGSGRIAAQNVGQAEDCIQGRTQLMAHVGQEEALGAIGGLGGFLGY